MWLHEVWTKSLNIAGNVWRQIWYPICESKSYLFFQQSYTDVSSGPKRRLGLKNWSFQIAVLEKTLESPLYARRSNQSILKKINAVYSFEGLVLKIKLQYFSHLMPRANSMEKISDAGKDWGKEEKGMTEDEMVGWHHQLNGHEFEQTLGDGEGQGSLMCCSPWVPEETTEWLKKCLS